MMSKNFILVLAKHVSYVGNQSRCRVELTVSWEISWFLRGGFEGRGSEIWTKGGVDLGMAETKAAGMIASVMGSASPTYSCPQPSFLPLTHSP